MRENINPLQVVNELLSFAQLRNVNIHNNQKNPYVINSGAVQDTPIATSKLGTPVYSNIIFNKSIVNGWDDFIINDCLITVNQAKKIITTEIQGRDGTVKEYIGMDDFQIQIVGRLNGAYNVNPRSETKQLKQILDAGQPLALTSWWLQNLGITDIVIKSYNFPQTEGEYSTQYFSIDAISDKQVEARITGQ